jgi:type II secretory pathway pseudopilin PulG
MCSAKRQSDPEPQSGERGYVLLALLLFVALLSIGIFTTIERIDFQIKRDREEELIHRGVQYSRAVRKYFKAFGRYPSRVEELESTNNQRFLRQRYKDPVTGKDFKLLRMTDVQMSFGPGPGVPAADLNNKQPTPDDANNDAPASGNGGTPDPSSPPVAPGDTSQPSQPVNAGAAGGSPQQLGANGSPQVFGGAGIVGVASVSKNQTIREFNKKNHYNQWQFIYDPTTDRGGLLMTPNQPPLQGTNQVAPLNGPVGTNPLDQNNNGRSNPQPPNPQ